MRIEESGLKVAIVHDWLTSFGGAERVLQRLLDLYPQADLYSVVDYLSDDQRQGLRAQSTTQSFIQGLPFARTKYRSFLPLMPYAVEQWDFSAYDLVLSSSYCVAKGILTGPDQIHISYVHSPMRYAWDLQAQYLKQASFSGIKDKLARYFLHKLRLWDQLSAQRPDVVIANSGYVQKRIAKYWGRTAQVIHPPVEVNRFTCTPQNEGYYLMVTRLVPYKMATLAVEAFKKMADKKLVIIGEGPDLDRLRAMGAHNVQLLGRQDDQTVKRYMEGCKAFLFPQVEDFGISALEAQACGKPVIAYRKGGALETLIGQEAEQPTGFFFDHQDADGLCRAVAGFEDTISRFTPEACRENAHRFDAEHFLSAIQAVVAQAMASD